MNLTAFSLEVKEWADHNFPDRDLTTIAGKVCEEAGELMGATIKEAQGIRKFEDQEAAAGDAVGDVVIALANYCSTRGWDFEAIVRETWSHVGQRDWVKDPETAHLL